MYVGIKVCMLLGIVCMYMLAVCCCIRQPAGMSAAMCLFLWSSVVVVVVVVVFFSLHVSFLCSFPSRLEDRGAKPGGRGRGMVRYTTYLVDTTRQEEEGGNGRGVGRIIHVGERTSGRRVTGRSGW